MLINCQIVDELQTEVLFEKSKFFLVEEIRRAELKIVFFGMDRNSFK